MLSSLSLRTNIAKAFRDCKRNLFPFERILFLTFVNAYEIILSMKEIEYLIKKHGGKEAVAKLLEITVRYVNMLLAGKKPGRQLAKIIRMYAPR